MIRYQTFILETESDLSLGIIFVNLNVQTWIYKLVSFLILELFSSESLRSSEGQIILSKRNIIFLLQELIIDKLIVVNIRPVNWDL